MRKWTCFIILWSLLLGCAQIALGNETAPDSEPCGKADREVETERLSPMWENRQLDTISMNVFFHRKAAPRHPNLSFYSGVTISRAWGYITESNIHISDEAVGAGPVYLVRYEPWQWDKLALAVDMSGGIIFYNENFPAGGDFYNFMWRLGPKLIYALNENYAVSIGCKIMHVSNGQHGRMRNPSYNGQGFSVSVMKKL